MSGGGTKPREHALGEGTLVPGVPGQQHVHPGRRLVKEVAPENPRCTLRPGIHDGRLRERIDVGAAPGGPGFRHGDRDQPAAGPEVQDPRPRTSSGRA